MITSQHGRDGVKLETAAVRAGIDSDSAHGAVVPPIYLSSNYTFAGFDQKRAYDYTRSGNPTRDALADALAELEGGAGAVVTASGMAAIGLVLWLVPPGGRVIAAHDGYGGTHRLLTALAARGAIQLEFVDLTDLATARAAIDDPEAGPPALVWIETPSNPLLRITDIAAVSAAAKARGALVAVDNTFLSPALQTPIAFGADIVVHSTTKYLNGHSDVVGGAVVAATEELHEQLAWWANCVGITGAPFDSFMTLRGVRTLHARLAMHESNAAAVVDALVRHPAVAKVHHPSLSDHPGHALARRQQRGFGGMLSFELGGGREVAARVCESFRVFSLAESLGGVESLVAHPATMTHAAMDAEARRTAGVSEGLIRLSVGIEAAADLVADLERVLDQVLDACAPPRYEPTNFAT